MRADDELPDIAISAEEWRTVRAILQRHVPACTVWAFGSRARRSAKPASDLDLAIACREPLGIATLAALADDFDESALPYKVDVLDWCTASEGFRRAVTGDRVLLQPGVGEHALA